MGYVTGSVEGSGTVKGELSKSQLTLLLKPVSRRDAAGCGHIQVVGSAPKVQACVLRAPNPYLLTLPVVSIQAPPICPLLP